MTREEDLIRIARKLDKMVSRNNTEGAMDLLKELKSFNMTLKLLQETRIGMSVNGIRKHCTDEEVTALAKVLIKDWKRLLDSGQSHTEKSAEMKNGLDSSRTAACPNSSLSETQSSHKRLDVKPKHESEPDKKHSNKNRKEKHNNEHKNNKQHADDPKDEKHLVQSQNEKHPQEKQLEEPKKQRAVEPLQHALDNKKHKDVQDLQSEKHKPEPRKEGPLEEPKKTRHVEGLRKEKHSDEPKKHSYTDDVKDKHREESRNERPTNTLQRERPPSDPEREKPADAHKPIFERRDSCDSKPCQPVKRHSTDSKPDRRESTDSKMSSSPPAKKLTGERRESHGSKTLQPGPPQRKLSTDTERKGKNDAPKTPTTPTSPMSPSFSSAGGPLSPHLATGDSIRDKCIDMLAAALRTDNDYKDFGANCDNMAAEIEDHIYQEIKATDMKYKNRVRSRISNLKDPKNPGLRRNVLAGSIELSRIAAMSAEEMASDELKQLRNILTQEAIREHQMAKTGGTTTDLLQCGKCKKKNCTYNQVQTRSADEPMTTFVLCNECGNRWKFC
uniref:Transcription elongation factor A (SII), 3 n=1 Tax=Mastacembelus armatus TaxID=205130 RepID=A0A3Q3N741_9TELE